MKGCKLRQCCHLFVDLRVILHGAGTQGIKPVVHTKVICTQIGIVADHCHLVTLGQRSIFLAAHRGWNLIAAKLILGQRIARTTLLRQLENQISV